MILPEQLYYIFLPSILSSLSNTLHLEGISHILACWPVLHIPLAISPSVWALCWMTSSKCKDGFVKLCNIFLGFHCSHSLSLDGIIGTYLIGLPFSLSPKEIVTTAWLYYTVLEQKTYFQEIKFTQLIAQDMKNSWRAAVSKAGLLKSIFMKSTLSVSFSWPRQKYFSFDHFDNSILFLLSC